MALLRARPISDIKRTLSVMTPYIRLTWLSTFRLITADRLEKGVAPVGQDGQRPFRLSP